MQVRVHTSDAWLEAQGHRLSVELQDRSRGKTSDTAAERLSSVGNGPALHLGRGCKENRTQNALAEAQNTETPKCSELLLTHILEGAVLPLLQNNATHRKRGRDRRQDLIVLAVWRFSVSRWCGPGVTRLHEYEAFFDKAQGLQMGSW